MKAIQRILFAGAWLAVANALAQQVPITLIVPSAPGGPSDRFARNQLQAFSRAVGQPVEILNVPGAAGTLAVSRLLNSPADGRTVLLGDSTLIDVVPKSTQVPYAATDLIEVATLAFSGFVLAVPSSSNVRSVNELLAQASSRQLTYGIPGEVSMANYLGDQLSRRVGRSKSVAYKGESPIVRDLADGALDFAFLSPLASQDPRIRPLAVTGPRELPRWSGVPTMASAGLSEFSQPYKYMAFVRAGTSGSKISELAQAFATTFSDGQVRMSFEQMGFIPNESQSIAYSIRTQSPRVVTPPSPIVPSAGVQGKWSALPGNSNAVIVPSLGGGTLGASR